MPELICKILHISKTTYYKYKKDEIPIVKFLHLFSKEELLYFLEKNYFKKFEKSTFKSDLSEYFIALEAVAIATKRKTELANDIKQLMRKYTL